jgi:hypothetical protein
MRKVLIILLVLILTTSSGQAQQAWCEKNCVSLCNKIFGAQKSGPCIAQYQCSQYAGRSCASAAYVNARHVVYCGNHPQECVGGSTR